ncbi:hypothetical protein [Streptomyces niveus]|uniref:hypothetical protein n=1 Tax=Streptomyces niveus TaxID=193462 RepID=UPI003447C8FC
MFRNHTDQDRDGQEAAQARPSLSLEVLIHSDGRVTVDGAPFPLPDGEAVNVAVLDTMQHRARSAGEPIEAVIVDRQAGYATRIEVTADGSSRIVRHERYREPSEEESSAEPPVPVPVELSALVTQIGQAIDSGALERAAALAFRLREHAARTFGAEHPYTLEAQALEAFAAHKSGNHTAATAACLELARIRQEQGDPRAHEDLLRAVAVWQLIDDLPSAVDHGRALLTTWSRLAEDGRTAVGDVELVRGVDRRIHALATEAAAVGSAVA